MPENISSIAFHEDFLLWTEVSLEENSATIKKAVSESLPQTIDHRAIRNENVVEQMAALIKSVRDSHQFDSKKVRISLPGKFTLVKKIRVDQTIPEENYDEIIFLELSKTWQERPDNYQLYLVEKIQRDDNSADLLVVAVRKTVLEFFNQVAEACQLDPEMVTPVSFSLDEYCRKLFPNSSGDTLLLGWQRRGYDIIISGKNNFQNYQFKTYNSNLDSIEQLDEEDLVSGFESLVEEIRQPSILEKPLYDIQTVLLYGFHLNPQWLEMLKAQVQFPVRLFNATEELPFQISIEDPELLPEKVFQFIEPISNVF